MLEMQSRLGKRAHIKRYSTLGYVESLEGSLCRLLMGVAAGNKRALP